MLALRPSTLHPPHLVRFVNPWCFIIVHDDFFRGRRHSAESTIRNESDESTRKHSSPHPYRLSSSPCQGHLPTKYVLVLSIAVACFGGLLLLFLFFFSSGLIHRSSTVLECCSAERFLRPFPFLGYLTLGKTLDSPHVFIC